MADHPAAFEIGLVAAIRSIERLDAKHGECEFTAAQSVLAARAVLASPELQAVRRLIAATHAFLGIDEFEATITERLAVNTELMAAYNGLPGSVRVWATQPEGGV